MMKLEIPNDIYEQMIEQSNDPVVKAFSLRDGRKTEVTVRIEKE